MIITKVISAIFIGLLLSVGLWVACYIFLMKMYPMYSLRIRHHLFSFLVAIATFILYCSFSTVSATISGIEYTLNSVKAIVIEKSNLADNLTSVLLSKSDEQKFVDEMNSYVSDAFAANGKYDDYIERIDFSQLNMQKITGVLNTNNLSAKEKSLQIIDILFNTYVKKYTVVLNRTWWVLLFSLIFTQLMYWGVMIYRAENKDKRRRTYGSRLSVDVDGATGNYRRKSSDYHRRSWE